MIELTMPIRLYWDLAVNTMADEILKSLCDDVERFPFLSIHLHDPSPNLSEAARYLITSLNAPRRIVMLTVTLSAFSTLIDGSSGVHTLYVMVATESELHQAAGVRQQQPSQRVGISIDSTMVDLEDLPKLIGLAHSLGFMDIHLPMERVLPGKTCKNLLPARLLALADICNASPLPDPLRLNVHDPFIWRQFYSCKPFPGGGCQAANTMIYISPDATLYACPMLPIPLGNLYSTSLSDILCADTKTELRKEIRSRPEACNGCQEFSICKAGCRGRAYLHGGWEAADPACGVLT